MRDGLPTISFALVALELSLGKEHPCSVSNGASIPVGQNLLLSFIDPVPFGAHINAACDTSFITTLVDEEKLVMIRPVLLLARQSYGRG